MATPIIEQVLAAFYTQATSTLSTHIPGVVTYRNRVRPLPEDQAKSVVVLDGPQIILNDDTCQTTYQLDVEVELYARTALEDDIGPELNELYGHLVQLALSDHTLGGLCSDIQQGDVQDRYIDDESLTPTAAMFLTFQIIYQTAGGDPFNI